MIWLLTLSLAMPPQDMLVGRLPQSTLPPLQQIEKSKPPTVKSVGGDWHFPDQNEVLLPGNHWHYDPITGKWKQHNDSWHGNVAAHTGEKGNVVWQKAYKPSAIIIPRVQYNSMNCPNGRCPKMP